MPIPVATRSEEWIRGRLLPRIVGSIPAAGMVICLLLVLCVVTNLNSPRFSRHGELPKGICAHLISTNSFYQVYIFYEVFPSKSFVLAFKRNLSYVFQPKAVLFISPS